MLRGWKWWLQALYMQNQKLEVSSSFLTGHPINFIFLSIYMCCSFCRNALPPFHRTIRAQHFSLIIHVLSHSDIFTKEIYSQQNKLRVLIQLGTQDDCITCHIILCLYYLQHYLWYRYTLWAVTTIYSMLRIKYE